MPQQITHRILIQNPLFITTLAHLCDFPLDSCSLVEEVLVDSGKVTFIMKTGLQQTHKIATSVIKITASKELEAIP